MKKTFALVALAVTCIALGAWAQSNNVIVTMPDGKIITVEVPETFVTLWARWGGILFSIVGVARFVLKFLPAADDGSNAPLAKIIRVLKHVSLAIPDKHQPDLSQTGIAVGTNVGTVTGKPIVG